MGMADITFAMARAMASYGDGSGYWIKAGWDAAVAASDLLGCFPPPFEEVEDYIGVTTLQCQCSALPGELRLQYLGTDGNLKKEAMSGPTQAKRILSKSFENGIATCRYEDGDGDPYSVESPIGDVNAADVVWFISPPAGSVCCEGEKPPVPRYGTPEPIPVDIPFENRQHEAILLDACIDKFGYLRNFYKIRQFDSNYEYDSDYYWESIDGPIKYIGSSFEGFRCSPQYGPPHRDRVMPMTTDGFGGGGAISGLNPVTYKLDAGCTWNEETGEYNSTTYYEIEQHDDGILALARRMDELAKMINDSGLIKYTTCGREQKLQGDPVTIAWISEEASSDSDMRLRKRTGYRSQSDRNSEQLQDYYRDFTWEAGPVCVGHKGARWGNPQVWASTEAEGKRVLRHIAGEAGLDPDQVGRWTVGGSDNPRYGMTGTMRVRHLGGYPWVMRRKGPNMLPI